MDQTSLVLATAVLIDPATKPYAKAIAGMRSLGAEVSVAPINDLAAIQHVNDWTAAQTKYRILAILARKKREPGIIAVNALYFKGLWSGPFSKNETQPQQFHGAERDFKVAMMHRSGTYNFRREGRFAAVEIPYKDDRYRLVLVTTLDRSSEIGQFSSVNNWLGGAGFSPAELQLSLPRFTLEGQVSLLDPLEAIGLKDGVESPTAFKGISELAQSVSEIFQKTYVQVNEEGTEVAAATSTTVELTSASVPAALVFDRPFVFGLRDKDTGLMLMAGYIDHPAAERSERGNAKAKR